MSFLGICSKLCEGGVHDVFNDMACLAFGECSIMLEGQLSQTFLTLTF